MKERGYFVVPLFKEGGDFALKLEEWCLRLFDEYDPEPVHGRAKQSYLTLCVGQAEADRLDAVLLEEDGPRDAGRCARGCARAHRSPARAVHELPRHGGRSQRPRG